MLFEAAEFRIVHSQEGHPIQDVSIIPIYHSELYERTSKCFLVNFWNNIPSDISELDS